jgi:hypothetical protein
VKLFLIILLGILALNALVILGVAGILLFDHIRARRKESNHDAHPKVS